jgi:hypothetical protein
MRLYSNIPADKVSIEAYVDVSIELGLRKILDEIDRRAERRMDKLQIEFKESVTEVKSEFKESVTEVKSDLKEVKMDLKNLNDLKTLFIVLGGLAGVIGVTNFSSLITFLNAFKSLFN